MLRSVVAGPFSIPSGSKIPTLLVGDFILVNKFTYGFRDPVFHTKFIKMNEPARGDVAVFRWPVDPSKDFIKRIIGIPGDHIARSEERRVGKACVRTCRSRWSPFLKNNTKHTHQRP